MMENHGMSHLQNIMAQGSNEMIEGKIMNIINENEFLKRRLDLSQKIITLLQQNVHINPLQAPEFASPDFLTENLMRYQYFNNPDN